MATKKSTGTHGVPKSQAVGAEPLDRDRLFASSILKHGKLAAFRESGDQLKALNAQARRHLAAQICSDRSGNKDDPRVQNLILEALSELDTVEVIDRARRTARESCKVSSRNRQAKPSRAAGGTATLVREEARPTMPGLRLVWSAADADRRRS